MRSDSGGGSPTASSYAVRRTDQQSEHQAAWSSATCRLAVVSGSPGWPGAVASNTAMQSSWFTAAPIGTKVGGGMCRQKSLGILECLAEGFAEAFQLPGDAVPGKSLTRRDLLFGQVFYELEPGHLVPLRGARHDGRAVGVVRQLLGGRGVVGQGAPQRVLGVVLRHAHVTPPARVAAPIARQVQDGVDEERAGPGLEAIRVAQRIELLARH